jgi:hypothetical protein
MSAEEELSFIEAYLGEVSPSVLRRLKWDILIEKKERKAETAKVEGSGE